MCPRRTHHKPKLDRFARVTRAIRTQRLIYRKARRTEVDARWILGAPYTIITSGRALVFASSTSRTAICSNTEKGK